MSWLYPVGIILLLLSPLSGITELDFSRLLDLDAPTSMIFWDIRVPRTLVAFFSGAALALCGLVFQTLFHNPLATPYTLGVSGGATLGTALAIKLNLTYTLLFISTVSLFGFLGALLTIILLLLFASRVQVLGYHSLLLVGIALSFFFSSLILIILYLGTFVETHTIIRYTMGSLSLSGYQPVLGSALAAFLTLMVVIYYARELELLSISEQNAHLRGVDTKKVGSVLMVLLSLAVGILVSITGPIGFVGLIIPNLVRFMDKRSIQKLLVKTFFTGGVFLACCDALARTLGGESEIPIGIVTAFFGAPFFIYLVIYRQKSP